MAEAETVVNLKSQENFVRENKIYILGPIDRSIASDVIPETVELVEALKTEKESAIEIYINSTGGYTSEMYSLMSLLTIARNHGIKIITYNLGVAFSCASMLAVFGDHRYMYKYAFNLPHLGQAFLSPRTVEQLDRGVKYVAMHFAGILDIYKEHTKMSRKELEKLLKDDSYYMNAMECLNNGFCDEIIC